MEHPGTARQCLTINIGTVSFGFDGLGRRVRKTNPAGANSFFLYDGTYLIAELDNGGNRVVEYSYYPGSDHPHSIILTVLVIGHLYFAPSFAVPIHRAAGESRLSTVWFLARALWRISPAVVVESILMPLTATAITIYWIVERVSP